MITIPRNKVAVVPVFDSQETQGGIIKPHALISKRQVAVYEIYDGFSGKKLEETDDPEMVRKYLQVYTRKGMFARSRKKQVVVEDQPLDAGERCDQGVVKYIGKDVKEVKIGDYVFFSGYSGTLMQIEGEGKLIILPESFIECTFDIDEFMEIPGLYFRDREGNFFTATYEHAMEVIGHTFTELKKTIEVKPQPPKYEDYNVSRN